MHLFWESTKSQKHCSENCVQDVYTRMYLLYVYIYLKVNVIYLVVNSWLI